MDEADRGTPASKAGGEGPASILDDFIGLLDDHSSYCQDAARYLEAMVTSQHTGDLRQHADGRRLADARGPFDRVLIELHQDELLALPADVLAVLAAPDARSWAMNSLLDVLFVHDKRLLAVLSRRDIMRSLLPAAAADALARHVIETHVVRHQRVDGDKDDWVLKPNLLGKGKGMLFGWQCSRAAWNAALASPDSREYVLQRYVPQLAFSIPDASPMHVIGLLPCFDTLCAGPGIYRAAPPADVPDGAGGLRGSAVNISSGEGRILVAATSSY